MYLPIVNRVEVDDVVCFTVLRCSLSLNDIVTAFNVNKDLIRIKLLAQSSMAQGAYSKGLFVGYASALDSIWSV